MEKMRQITSALSLSLLMLGGLSEYNFLIYISLGIVIIELAVIIISSRNETMQDARDNQVRNFVLKD